MLNARTRGRIGRLGEHLRQCTEGGGRFEKMSAGHQTGTARHAYLVVDLARGYGRIAQVFRVAVGRVEAAAGRDAVGWVIHTAEPTGVVIHATAAQLEKQRALMDQVRHIRQPLFSLFIKIEINVWPKRNSESARSR